MNPYALGSLLAAVALIQSTVTSQARILGVSPDLTLMLAVACVLRWGVRDSLPAILAGGLMVDVLAGAPFGCATLSMVLAALVAGIAEANVPRSVKLLPYATIATATVVYLLVFMALLVVWGRTVLWGPMLLRSVLPSVLVNVLFMPLIYLLVRRIGGQAPKEPPI